MTTKITRENIASHLLDHQLKLIGKTRVDMIDDDKWRIHWTITPAQHISLHDYAIPLIKKVFHCNKRKAEDAFTFFDNDFGLKIRA